jgi:hypothetical protein
MRYCISSFLTFLLFNCTLYAQDDGLRYEDWIYKAHIKSVQFHVAGLVLTQPIIDLGAEVALQFSFDDLEGGVKDYLYSVVHCDANWEPSVLAEMEYIDGFSEDRINDWRFSAKTLTPYTHYSLSLPHSDMRITKSGNYLLKVYESGRRKTLAITRRFMVVEPLVRITPRMVNTAAVSKLRTHQEIDFTVNHERLSIRAAQQEIRATILQNGRWDNAIKLLPPMFVRTDQLIYDFQDKIVFPGTKEFRFVDLRTLYSSTPGIASIERLENRLEVILERDGKRSGAAYIQFEDINGNYVLETRDQRNPLSAEYLNVLFMLQTNEPYYDHDVYIVGKFSDWQPREEFKMAYNNAVNAYVGKPTLRQGYYNYAYAIVPQYAKVKIPDISEIEGNWYETENEYTILIYYHPLGERYDRLIGVASFNSNTR